MDDKVNKYSNTYRSTIKIKSVELNPSIYLDFNKENSKEGPKFKLGDRVRISKYKNIFAKDYVPNSSEEVFVIKKANNTVPWAYVISDLKDKELLGRFTKKNCKKQIKKSLELKK